MRELKVIIVGTNGSGKSTLNVAIAQFLKEKGITVLPAEEMETLPGIIESTLDQRLASIAERSKEYPVQIETKHLPPAFARYNQAR